MKIFKKKYLLIFIGMGLLSIPIIHYFVEKNYKNITEHPVRYCYEEFAGTPNAVLIVKNKDDIPLLIEHYKNLEKKIDTYFSFDLRTLSMYEPVYLMGYPEKDSAVAEVVSFNNYGKFGGDYIRGYVYSKSLHLIPPVKNK